MAAMPTEESPRPWLPFRALLGEREREGADGRKEGKERDVMAHLLFRLGRRHRLVT